MSDPRRNVELKAHLPSLAAARQIARALCPGRPICENQIDTYFQCSHGRLKLREINGDSAQLIAYSRPDQTEAKVSRYRIVPVDDPAALKTLLTESLGVLTVVRKSREIYLYRHARIHLDEVDGLGAFLEFEAVMEEAMDSTEGEMLVDELRQRFAIPFGDRIDVSYSDLLT